MSACFAQYITRLLERKRLRSNNSNELLLSGQFNLQTLKFMCSTSSNSLLLFHYLQSKLIPPLSFELLDQSIHLQHFSILSGLNRKIRYTLIDSAKGFFNIAPESGLITLMKRLDRETQDLYNLTVKASDQGNPPLSNVTNIEIVVLDVNDNPPEFMQRFVHLIILVLFPVTPSKLWYVSISSCNFCAKSLLLITLL